LFVCEEKRRKKEKEDGAAVEWIARLLLVRFSALGLGVPRQVVHVEDTLCVAYSAAVCFGCCVMWGGKIQKKGYCVGMRDAAIVKKMWIRRREKKLNVGYIR
jgi:hypothetical protein